MTTLWDTTGSAVVKELAAQRRTGGAVLSGVALTLVVVADESRVAEAEEAATHAAETHPCRLLIVVRRQIEAPGAPPGRRGADRRPARPGRGGRACGCTAGSALHAESVVLPLLAADAPVVAWWHGRAPGPAGHRRARRLRRPPDHRQLAGRGPARRAAHPGRGLRPRRHRPGLDPQHRLAGDPRLHPRLRRRPPGRRRCASPAAGSRATRHNATAQLLAGWLSSRAGCSVEVVAGSRDAGPSGVEAVVLQLDEERGGADRTPTAGAAPSSPSPTGPTARWRCPPGPSATCSARSCAGWTPTSPTARPSRRRPGSTGLTERSPEREHVWFDPAAEDDGEPGRAKPLARRRRRRARDAGGPRPTSSSSPTPTGWRGAVAEALVARLAAAQALRGTASVVLTGGAIGIAVLERVAGLAAEPVRETVDWAAVDVWWGDERFVPADDDDRNEKAARQALLDVVGVDPARVHAMPASDGGVRRAGGRRRPVRRRAGGRGGRRRHLPRFDVLLLGMGPEGHVASIFPDSPAVDDERPVFAVRDCPKPPPTRISLGFTAIGAADEVWLVVSGEGKAEAVRPAPCPGRSRASSRPPACTAPGRRAGCSTPPRPPGCPGAERYIPRRARRRVSASSRRASPSASCAAPARRPGGSCTARCAAPAAGCAGPARRGGRSGGSPTAPGRRRRWRRRSASRARWRTSTAAAAAVRSRRAPPRPSDLRRPCCPGSRCHQPRALPDIRSGRVADHHRAAKSRSWRADLRSRFRTRSRAAR